MDLKLKAFFSEEKKQKTFASLQACAAGWVRDSTDKSLLVLFFRKEHLPTLLPSLMEHHKRGRDRGGAPMASRTQFYINGHWMEPHSGGRREVINPATELPIAPVALANQDDVHRAVMAARAAFPAFTATSRAYRLDLLHRNHCHL